MTTIGEMAARFNVSVDEVKEQLIESEQFLHGRGVPMTSEHRAYLEATFDEDTELSPTGERLLTAWFSVEQYAPDDTVQIEWTVTISETYKRNLRAQELADMIGCEVSELGRRILDNNHDLENSLGDWEYGHADLNDAERTDIEITRVKDK